MVHTFEGDSSFHMLNTCGSEIDSKINIYTVDTTSTEAEACLLVTHSIEGGSYSYERGYFIISEAGDTVAEWIGTVPLALLSRANLTLFDGWRVHLRRHGLLW